MSSSFNTSQNSSQHTQSGDDVFTLTPPEAVAPVPKEKAERARARR